MEPAVFQGYRILILDYTAVSKFDESCDEHMTFLYKFLFTIDMSSILALKFSSSLVPCISCYAPNHHCPPPLLNERVSANARMTDNGSTLMSYDWNKSQLTSQARSSLPHTYLSTYQAENTGDSIFLKFEMS